MSAARHSAFAPNAPTVAARSVVLVQAAEALCALDVSVVLEICRVPEITRAPHAHSAVVGVVNIRGRVTPVVCLRAILDREPPGSMTGGCVLVIDGPDSAFGLIVDRALSVAPFDSLSISANAHHPASALCDEIVVAADGRSIAILDPSRIMPRCEPHDLCL